MQSTNKVYAIVPARSGSKGVPNKNIKQLGRHPLVAYSIAAAMLSSRIHRVVVSTDSEEIAAIGRAYGADVPFLRPAELADDFSTDREFVLHALEWFTANEGVQPDYLVHLRPTTPLRDPSLVDQAVDIMVSSVDATSLRSGHESPESPFKWFMRDDAGYFHGLGPDDPRPGYSNLPRQSFPTVYIPDGYVDVLRTSYVLSANDIHGERMLGYVSPHCVEVDSAADFEFLEYEIERNGSPLVQWLDSRRSEKV